MRIKALTSLLLTHNITADPAGTVVEMEDDGRANELIALGYAEKTSEKVTPYADTAGGKHATANAERVAAAKRTDAGLAAAKSAKADTELEEAEAAVENAGKAPDPKKGAPENKAVDTAKAGAK